MRFIVIKKGKKMIEVEIESIEIKVAFFIIFFSLS